jgi:hypothetical protein
MLSSRYGGDEKKDDRDRGYRKVDSASGVNSRVSHMLSFT